MRASWWAALVAVLALAAGCAAPGGTDGHDAIESGGSLECGTPVPGFVQHDVDLPGVRMHYAVVGDGPMVVLVHGFPETWRAWRAVAERLAGRFTVVVPDLRGVGCSSPEPDGYTPSALATDLHHLVRHLGAGSVSVVGHDLGGIVAVAWARDHPADVTRLVVSGAGVPGAGLEELAPPHVARFAADPDGVVAEFTGRERAWLAAFAASPAFTTSGALDDAVDAYGRPGRMRLALNQYVGLRDDVAAGRAAAERPLTVPVTALEGGAPGISAATLPRVARDVCSVVVPGAGHYLQVERPAEVADAISRAVRPPADAGGSCPGGRS